MTNHDSQALLSDVYRNALRAELTATVSASAHQRRPLPRKVKVVGAGTLAAVLVGSGGALAYSALSSAPVTDQGTARCYTSASQTGTDGASFPGTTVAVADGSSVSDATAACTALWQQGVLRAGATEPQAPDTQTVFTVPSLVPCVLSDGRAAIVPGTTGVCQTLGLVPETAH